LKDAIRFTDDASVWDYRDVKESEEESTALMSTIFSVVTALSMFLCFFSLVSSMTANMIE
jgi:hypothetical protein